MTQSELWLAKWQEAVDFLETKHRKPSKFIPEERNMRSWWKHNKKLMNAGELKAERVEMFKQLLDANSALNVPSGAFSNVPSVTDSNVPLQMWLL